jgi:hypothetical protein
MMILGILVRAADIPLNGRRASLRHSLRYRSRITRRLESYELMRLRLPGDDASPHWVRFKEGDTDPNLSQEPITETNRGTVVVRHIFCEIRLGGRVEP